MIPRREPDMGHICFNFCSFFDVFDITHILSADLFAIVRLILLSFRILESQKRNERSVHKSQIAVHLLYPQTWLVQSQG